MTERDRRAVVLGGAVAVTAVLVLRLLPWSARSVLAARRALDEQAALLARARADVAGTSLLRDSAAAVTQALVALAPKILSGNMLSEAVADLSDRVSLAASRSQAKVERVDPVTDSVTVGRLRRATLRVALECDVRGLRGVLQALEDGKTVLSVSELRVTAADVASSDMSPEVLRVEFTIFGWFLERGQGVHGKSEAVAS